MSIDDDDILDFDARADENRSDDEILADAIKQIDAWQADSTQGLDAVQEFFHAAIKDDASAMVRDKIIDLLQAAFGTELGGKRAMINTWNTILKDVSAERAQKARVSVTQELTPQEKAEKREALWPTVRELAEAP